MLHTDSDDPAVGGLWTSLNRFLAVCIAIIVLTVIGYRYMPELGKRREQEARIEELSSKIDDEKRMLARRNREELFLKGDSEYAGLIARDRLDLMKEGETIYRIEAPRPDPAKMRLVR